MSDEANNLDLGGAENIGEFIEERIAPLLGEVFDGFVLAGIGVDGKCRAMFFGGTEEGRKAPELHDVLRSAIIFAEGDCNTSQQSEDGQ